MSTSDLILFSGGPDSTVLLKHFLQQKIKVRVLYIQMGWAIRTQPRIKLQNMAVNNVMKYLREKYGDFEYSQASILTTLNEQNEDKYFATDHQWCAFFGSMFCHNYNIKRMWAGNYTYTDAVVQKRDGKSENYLNDNDLNMWIESATKFFARPKYCTPKSEYKGKGLDSFKSKKEAWDSLETELKNMVRSCVSHKWFCGDCPKCWTAKEYNLRDNKGNPL